MVAPKKLQTKKKLPSCLTESSSKHTLDKPFARPNPSSFCNASSITTLNSAFRQVSNSLQTLVLRLYASHFKDSCTSCCVSVAPLVGRLSPLTTATSTTVLRLTLNRDIGKLFRVDLTLPLISLKVEVFDITPPRRYPNPLLLRPHITIGAQVWLLLYANMILDTCPPVKATGTTSSALPALPPPGYDCVCLEISIDQLLAPTELSIDVFLAP